MIQVLDSEFDKYYQQVARIVGQKKNISWGTTSQCFHNFLALSLLIKKIIGTSS